MLDFIKSTCKKVGDLFGFDKPALFGGIILLVLAVIVLVCVIFIIVNACKKKKAKAVKQLNCSN